jgi:hypothetical protein
MGFSKQTLIVALLAITLICTLRAVSAVKASPASLQGGTAVQAYQELIEQSQKEKKGLTFFIKGQTVAGFVTKMIGSEAVEVRNQTYSRVIIRLDQVDAVAIN